MGTVMPLMELWIAYCMEVNTSPEMTSTTEAPEATPPDHSRSRSVSDKSPEAAPLAAVCGAVPGTVTTVGSLAGRPAAARKSVMSAGIICVLSHHGDGHTGAGKTGRGKEDPDRRW